MELMKTIKKFKETDKIPIDANFLYTFVHEISDKLRYEEIRYYVYEVPVPKKKTRKKK